MVLEWREREHEEDDAIVGNHPATIALYETVVS
jgi:hypothetical protein